MVRCGRFWRPCIGGCTVSSLLLALMRVSSIMHSLCSSLDAGSALFVSIDKLLHADPAIMGMPCSPSCASDDGPAAWAPWSGPVHDNIIPVDLPIAYERLLGVLRDSLLTDRWADCVLLGVRWHSPSGLTWYWLFWTSSHLLNPLR